MKKACIDHQTDLEKRQFLPERLDVSSGFHAEISASYILMSEHQYLLRFGCHHRAKDTKLVQIAVTGLSGELERYWVFRDDQEPYKRLKLSATSDEVKTTACMQPDEHIHADQGTLLMKHALQGRLQQSSLAELVQKNPCVTTVAEYATRLAKKKGSDQKEQSDTEVEDNDPDPDAIMKDESQSSMADVGTTVAEPVRRLHWQTPSPEEKKKKKRKLQAAPSRPRVP